MVPAAQAECNARVPREDDARWEYVGPEEIGGVW